MRHSEKASTRWTYSSSCVYNLSYHIIWCPKYRKKVLVGEVAEKLKAFIEDRSMDNGWTVRSLEVMPDHVHVFLSAKPSNSIAQILSVLKGGSAKILRDAFPHLKRLLPSLWTRSYYVESIGHVSAKTIERYIADQKTRPSSTGRRHSTHG